MDKDSKSGSGALPGNGIVAVVLLVMGALFVRESPLVNTRPAADEQRIEQRHALGEIEQDVEARLWQDPLGAVARYRAPFAKAGPEQLKKEDGRHSFAAMQREMDKKVAEAGEGLPPQVFVVLMAGGHYSDNVENRRRERYAVLAALDAGRLTPADTENIGYFIPELDEKKNPDEEPVPVPYEWMDPAVDPPARGPAPAEKDWSTTPLRAPVLVMWMQGDLLGSRPMDKLLRLASRFPRSVGWRVLGPTASDGLKTMIDEADKPDRRTPEQVQALARMRIYSLYATVPKEVLLQQGGAEAAKGKCRSDLDKCLNEDLHLVRTVDDDRHLAEALIAELELRGLKTSNDVSAADCKDRETRTPTSQIAIVAEWDTLYGRSLRNNFQPSDDPSARRGFCVDSYNYVRGLDGQAAEAGGGSKDAAAKAGASGKDEGRRNDGTFIEVAEGQSQFDYLRRLAVQMRTKDEMLRRTRGDHKGFRAIGVLGTDVHDKLLVMQALRSELPDAIFFTTDMDARFLHPREQAWARNLVVASTFGLQLSRSIQLGVPPFRDSYQTSAYLATRLAMNDALPGKHDSVAELQKRLDESFKPWRIFEIGRTMAFDYKGQPRGAAKRTGCATKLWGLCDIHPPGSEAYPKPGALAIGSVCSLLILLAWLPWLLVFRGTRGYFAGLVQNAIQHSRARWKLLAWGLGVMALQLLVPMGLALHWDALATHLTFNGEPMVATEGISVWPSEGLRILTTLLCCYLIIRSWLMLSYNLDDINLAFKSAEARDDLEAQRLGLDRQLLGPVRRFIQMFLMNFIEPLGGRSKDLRTHGICGAALKLWGQHIVQNTFWARIARAIAWALLALAFTGLLFLITADARFIPSRGDQVIEWHKYLRIAAMLAMYLLMAFVVDATVLCVHFVRGLMKLRDQACTWPDTTVDHFSRELGFTHAVIVSAWIDLQFMARRTACVTRLIYYPFIVLSLWLLSRNPAFDRWTVSFSAMAPAVLGALVMLACGYSLHRAAQASRDDALERLNNGISAASAKAERQPSEPTAEQLKQLRTRIEGLDEGAFASFWQQPLLKAMALPFATLGGTSLLDYLAQAKL